MYEPVYLDCNATTPLDPTVKQVLTHWFNTEVGNAGSRTHDYGQRAKNGVQQARAQVASVVAAAPEEVLFTSGATESNNLAVLGLASHGEETGRKHVVTTAIEHKAILEPMEVLAGRGFDVTIIPPERSGVVPTEAILASVRPDTLLVSVMHVNNETGVRQPIDEIASGLRGHETFLHVDAAQGFGKEFEALQAPRVDLISISSHKIHGPAGVGALVARRRDRSRPPLSPLFYGGGQERGLRPGTLPAAPIVGFGTAAQAAIDGASKRKERCKAIREQALEALGELDFQVHGDSRHSLPHVLNFSVKGVDSEAMMLALKDLVAISNGSACTSQSYAPSHVLEAMELPPSTIAGAVRLSWCHMTPDVDWAAIVERIKELH